MSAVENTVCSGNCTSRIITNCETPKQEVKGSCQCKSEMSCAKLEKFQITEILTAQRGLCFKGSTELCLCSYNAFWGQAAGGAVG
jgi:hypothetical protein